MSPAELADMSVYELYRLEVDAQAPLLTDALLALEAQTLPAEQLRTCMRCVHSLKGAARMVQLGAGADVAHAMEECLVAAQQGALALRRVHVDTLLLGLDLLKRIAHTPAPQIGRWLGRDDPDGLAYQARLRLAMAAPDTGGADLGAGAPVPPEPADPLPPPEPGAAAPPGRVLRVTADKLKRLLGLAGEALVGSRWLTPFADALLRQTRMQAESCRGLERLEQLLAAHALDDDSVAALAQLKLQLEQSRQALVQGQHELERFAWRESDLARRLYDEALASRMRPFGDAAGAFPRMVRELGHALGKQVTLAIEGQATLVDRDILEQLEAPLTHLLRNAVDHGVDTPAQRAAAGKPPGAVLRLAAGHRAGRLLVTLSDDGRGIASAGLRQRIVARGLTDAATALQLSDAELFEFLFLPGFTMKDEVSDISGRGVGLDVVQHMLKQVRGSVGVASRPGLGTTFSLQLPLTTSVVRALLVEIDGEPYAFPLAYVNRAVELRGDQVGQSEGRQHFAFGGRQVGLVTAHQLLQSQAARFPGRFPVVVVGEGERCYGVAVDRLLGERELVVQPLDARLGKIQDVLCGALMEDGAPLLVIDVDDLLRSIDRLVAAGPPQQAQRLPDGAAAAAAGARKRVLLVDDSLTVRELERKLLQRRGYEVEVAVDGVDGWNAARLGHFDLVITDVDMPRMDGIELVTLIKRHPQLRATPVLIVSYKDREDDQRRGLDAGADYYLSKGSFHDERLLDAVADLIGEAGP